MISAVGYLHENPELEALLLHKGIQAIDEDELLQIIDMALSLKMTKSHAYHAFAQSHVLTGLEPLGLKELRKKDFATNTERPAGFGAGRILGWRSGLERQGRRSSDWNGQGHLIQHYHRTVPCSNRAAEFQLQSSRFLSAADQHNRRKRHRDDR